MRIGLASLLLISSVIGLALSSHLNPFACSVLNSITCAASGLGITAGCMGIVLSILSILKKWKYFIVFGMFVNTAIAFTSGVLWGIYSTRSGELYFAELGAVTSIQLFVSMFAVIFGFFIVLDK